MTELELRQSYIQGRIIIESERVLTSQFRSIGAVFTGGEIEILRNLVNYAARQSTFVRSYREGYYLMPSEDDWSDVETIVAGLEEKLMGTENTIFGFNERWVEQASNLSASVGTNDLAFDPVPAGYVYTLDMLGGVNVNTGAVMEFRVTGGAIPVTVSPGTAPGAGIWKWVFPIGIRLAEGDVVTVRFFGCALNDDLFGRLWGYKMKVED